MTFLQKLDKAIDKNNSLLCVGLDPQIDKMPDRYRKEKYPLFAFNKYIIEQTHDAVCSYKPNSAFYEAYGAHGIMQLKLTCDYLISTHPHIPIILDAKRGDIGNTNVGYVNFSFNYLQADAITLHPFSGKEGMKEFLDQREKGCIIWCKGSNPGSGEFQDIQFNGTNLYEIIAEHVVNQWNYNNNCLLVVGATFPVQLNTIRKIIGDDMFILIPGTGAQGGSVKDSVLNGKNSKGKGIIISTSRSIIYPSITRNNGDPVRSMAKKFNEEINSYR